nr:MAG TPA_asm: hypothetical protein [Caudoviricetes sp.]
MFIDLIDTRYYNINKFIIQHFFEKFCIIG